MSANHSPRLLIIDGHAYAYRAFHAIRQLSSPTGEPTNAIYGFIKTLGKMRAQLAPTHVAVVWDAGLAVERLAELPEYKSQRPPMPASLEAQIEGIQGYLPAAGLVSLCQPGVEADDWIAALARQAQGVGMDVVIASSDKDFMQLVSPGIGMLNPNDKSEKVWTAEDVRARTGVTPEQVVDWLSLIGDSVDNIPGVPGVGTKTAAGLLNQFGSVDGLYSRLHEVKPERLQAALASSAATVRRNQRLIRLKEEAPCSTVLDDLAPRPADGQRLKPLYTQWGFKTLLSQLNETPSWF